MLQHYRQALAAVALTALGSVSSSAWAASYTVDFKTFFNTATESLTDTKTMPYSVAQLTFSDLSDGSGVQFTLKQTSHTFATQTGNQSFIDALWIKGVDGALNLVSGPALDADAGYVGGNGLLKDVGYRYNWNVDFAGDGFAENQTAVFTLTGAGLTADSIAQTARLTPIMLSLGNVGGQYGLAEMDYTVHFTSNLPVAAVPEPMSVALMGLGLVGVAVARRRQMKR